MTDQMQEQQRRDRVHHIEVADEKSSLIVKQSCAENLCKNTIATCVYPCALL